MVSIYQYQDYRQYLQDFYTQEKQRNPRFSLRNFALRAGIPVSTASVFASIVRGRRHISEEYIQKFIKGMGLRGKDAEYFELLVKFNKSKRHEQKSSYYRKLITYHPSNSQILSRDQYEFFNKWYYSAIWTLMQFWRQKKDGMDFELIGRSLHPSIPASQVKCAVELLERLGFIRVDAHGIYTTAQPVLTTGDEVRSVQVADYQIENMRLAIAAIDACPAESRDISTVTLGISTKAFSAIKEKVRRFRKELLEIARHDQNEDIVYQCNFQIFPITKQIQRTKS